MAPESSALQRPHSSTPRRDPLMGRESRRAQQQRSSRPHTAVTRELRDPPPPLHPGAEGGQHKRPQSTAAESPCDPRPDLSRHRMNPLLSLILLGSVVLAFGCAPAPGATNLARTGVASQVSDYPYSISGVAKNAIDGNKDTDFHKASCTHTKMEKNPWWKLDLKQSYKISVVVLTNRKDCCSQRLMGAEVRIGNSPDNNNPVCGTVTNVTSATLTFCCNDMEGQYVSVVIPGRSEYLTLCEVEVYGEPVTNSNNDSC